MKFNIILEDGGIYKNAIVLTSRGMAENLRHVYSALKYEGGICICNKHFLNELIKAKDVYAVEQVPKKILNSEFNSTENNFNDDDDCDNDIKIYTIPESNFNPKERLFKNKTEKDI